MRRLTLVILAVLGACGDSGTEPHVEPEPEPEPVDPGPANIVVRSWEQDGDVVTELENTGGPGAFRLDFFGGYANQPYGCPAAQFPCPCRQTFLASTETVTVEEDYEETVAWDTSDLSVDIVEAHSRDENSAVWRETSRVKDSSCS